MRALLFAILFSFSASACGPNEPNPRDPIFPNAGSTDGTLSKPPLDPNSKETLPASTKPCVSDAARVCGPFTADLIALCLKHSTNDFAGKSACHSARWSKAFHDSLVQTLARNPRKESEDLAFKKVLPHILKWEGGCSDHPADKGGRTYKGITAATARANGWTGDVCTLPDSTITAIYRKDYWEKRAKNFLWPMNLAVMNTEVNSGGGRAQKVLDRMKAEGIGGGLVAQATWFIEQQTALYKHIVERDPSQKVFFEGWLNRSNDMQRVVAGKLETALSLVEVEGTFTAKAWFP
ncbi:MAG: hypothetical protein IOD12_09460 [Silvanigrellales bacterium]|nr:hypothetical protein [Silvanigrellales bacterium]